MDQYLQPAPIRRDFTQDGASLKNCVPDPETNPSNGFECNICLDLVQDPVVTFCGHLYCWPCIYRWISFRDDEDDHRHLTVENQKPQCPVCKREVSEKTIIPLYGRGQNTNSSKGGISHPIPQRPQSPRCGANMLLIPNSGDNLRQFRNRDYLEQSRAFDGGNYTRLGGSTTPLADPMIGMFGEMVYARIFGNSETTLYTYPNSYRAAGSSSPRLRRHMMQADESLSRVCFFLCCCVMLCLLLF